MRGSWSVARCKCRSAADTVGKTAKRAAKPRGGSSQSQEKGASFRRKLGEMPWRGAGLVIWMLVIEPLVITIIAQGDLHPPFPLPFFFLLSGTAALGRCLIFFMQQAFSSLAIRGF